MRTKSLTVAAFLALGFGMAGSRADDSLPLEAPVAKAPSSITRVTLHLQGAVAQDAFDELAKQGGIKFTTNGNSWDGEGLQTEKDLDITDRPFWSAVNEACGLWNISVESNNFANSDAKTVMLNFVGSGPGEKTKIPAFESDGFLVQALSISRQQNINYAMSKQRQNFCTLQLAVFVDPAIHISTFDQNPKVEEAVDDAGNSMAADKASSMYFSSVSQRSLVHNISLPLKYPDNAGKNIARLKFTLSMRASDAMDSLSIDKPLDAAETSKDFGETTVTFHSLKKTEDSVYALKIGMSQGDNLGTNLPFELLRTAKLLDANGRAYRYAGGGGGGRGGGPDETLEYTINYRSLALRRGDAAVGEPVKWVLELPTKSHSIKLPVEFKDLPLP